MTPPSRITTGGLSIMAWSSKSRSAWKSPKLRQMSVSTLSFIGSRICCRGGTQCNDCRSRVKSRGRAERRAMRVNMRSMSPTPVRARRRSPSLMLSTIALRASSLRSIACRLAMGRNNSRRSKRAPMGVLQVFNTLYRVLSSPPCKLISISRLRRVDGSISTASLFCSWLRLVRCVSSSRWVSFT